jgi:signal peptidase I
MVRKPRGEMTQDNPPIAADDVEAIRRNRARSARLFARDIILIFAAAIIISVLIKTFLIRSFYIPSGSMENTLEVDDRIVVNELVPDLVPIERGDVVVFRDPGGWLAPMPEPRMNPITAGFDWFLGVVGLSASDSNDHLVKRVIGVPGDQVVCCNTFGQITINGVPIDEPYLKLPQGVTKASGVDFDVTVPEGSLWVLGDNRYDSKDSRYNTTQPGQGFVPIDNVVGRAFVVTWPVENWSWIDNYPTVFSGVDGGEG